MKTAFTSTRRHDLDWLRFLAILILLFFHTGMWFNTFGWHVKNAELTPSFDYWMIWLHFWRMPLLLFISGAGTYLALGKRSPRQFAGERIRKLLIPLVFGMLVVVPPQIYFEYIGKYGNYWDFYKTVFEFAPYPGGSFSWHHLWFILYLLIYSLLALPLLLFMKSPRSLGFKTLLYRVLGAPWGMVGIPSGFILLTQVLLRPYFPEETHALVDDWAFFTFYACFFLLGMLFYSTPQLWETVRLNRKYLLVAALLMLIPFYGCYLHMRGVIALPMTAREAEVVFDVSAIFLSWFTVITVVGYAQQYLNRPHPWLKHVNEGLYPFYILHQTVIIWIGYYICQLDWGILAKFCAISLLTLVGCIGFYLLCIRPFNVMRLLFGMKWKD
ncbi:acyltransferase family protein [Parapedobacter sp. DT-150]|uniref:acyltransferase family protein n=1 Tax=Parapedobacter sp. DT-150 TaxID=3396162 RepID=UPI003F1DB720